MTFSFKKATKRDEFTIQLPHEIELFIHLLVLRKQRDPMGDLYFARKYVFLRQLQRTYRSQLSEGGVLGQHHGKARRGRGVDGECRHAREVAVGESVGKLIKRGDGGVGVFADT